MRSQKLANAKEAVKRLQKFSCVHECNNSKYSYCSLCRNLNNYKEPIRETIPKSKKPPIIQNRKKRSTTVKVKSRNSSNERGAKSKERQDEQEMLERMKGKLESQRKMISHLMMKVDKNNDEISNLKSATGRLDRTTSFKNVSPVRSDVETSQFIQNLKRKYCRDLENTYNESNTKKIRDNRAISLHINSQDEYKTNKYNSGDSFRNDSLIRVQQKADIELNAAHKKIQRLEAELTTKDNLLLTQEQKFLDKIRSMQERLDQVERQNTSSSDFQKEIDNYRKRLDLKQRELDITKASFAERLDKEKSYHRQRKKDWKSIYGALLEDIGRLKQELMESTPL